MAAAEVAPFARVGGLSDVVGALSKASAELGHEVSVFLPKYRSVDAASYGFTRLDDPGALTVPMGEKKETVEIWRGLMPGCDRMTVYLRPTCCILTTTTLPWRRSTCASSTATFPA